MLNRLVNQKRCCLFGINRFVEQDAVDDFIWHNAAEAVTAKHPSIARCSLKGFGINFGGNLDVTQHSHKHASAGVRERLLGGDSTRVDQSLNEGVVFGDLRNLAFADHVDARVADVGNGH